MEHCFLPCALCLVLQTHIKIKWSELKPSLWQLHDLIAKTDQELNPSEPLSNRGFMR